MSVLAEEEVIEELTGLGTTDRESLRRTVKANLYIFSKGILQYPDLTVGAHRDVCDFICGDDSLRRMALMPRVHLKSTNLTIADSIRIVAANPEYERVLISSETSTQAERFLKEIKRHWENNKVLRNLFPELVPSRFSGQGIDWASRTATLNRTAVHGESHWTTVGVGGAVTGFHFTRIKADDLIGLEAARSPAEMAAAKDWNDNIEPLLVDQHTSIIDWIGTRWSRNDLYAHIMEAYGDRLRVFVREAIEHGQIIFPEKHTWEEYQQLQIKSPSVWFAQYCNNPIAAGKQDFQSGLVRNFTFSADGDEIRFKSPTGEKRWKIAILDRVLTCDPNSGSTLAPDMAAAVVSAISPDDEIFVLDTFSQRCTPSELVDQIYKMAQRWSPRVIGIEKAGQQNTEHYFRRKMEEEKRFFNVQPVSPKNRNKEDRIRGYLEPIIRSGLLYLLPSQGVLREQIATFPDCLLIDELDALAYGPEVWRKPHSVEDMQSNEKAIRLLMQRRSRRTGY